MRCRELGLLALLACGTEEPGATTPTTLPVVDCEQSVLTWENTGGPILIGYCAPCHAETLGTDERQGAPVGIDFDSVALARPFGERIVERTTTAMDMPPGGALSDADQLRLADWVACGMP